MNPRLTALLFSIVCIMLAPVTFAGQGDAKPVRKTVRAKDGLAIVCEDRGKGDLGLVFLHGLCGDRSYWKNQADVFAADYRVVTLDHAGHGESGKNRKEWSVNALAGDVESVVKSLGLKRVILIGHSMSGPIALMAAKRMPGTVVAVVGVDTLPNVEVKMPEEASRKYFQTFEDNFQGAMRTMLPALLHENTDPELKKWLITKAEAQDPKMALGLMRDLFVLDSKVLLQEAKVPVRCINSAGGYQFFTPTAVAVNRKYGDYDAVLIEGVGHYPMLEKPAEFNEKLRGVLKEFAGKK